MNRYRLPLWTTAALLVLASTTAAADATGDLYASPTTYPNGSAGGGEAHTTVVSADLNGDGHPDLAFSDFLGSQVRVAFNNGDATFGPETTIPTGGSGASGLVAADLEGTGHPDLVVANLLSSTISVLRNRGDGQFALAATYPTGTAPANVRVGDFNGDGRPDIAAQTSQGVNVFLGQPDGTLRQSQSISLSGVFLTSLGSGQLTRSGHADLVVGDAAFGFTPLFGNGDGTFRVGTQVAVSGGHEDLTVADVNGDGYVDVVVGGVSSNSLKVFPGRGDGTFGSPVSSTVSPNPLPYLPPTFPVAVTVGDFNGDGQPDVAVSGGTDGTVYVMQGDGTGVFKTVESHNLGQGAVPRSLISSDLTGTGHLDLIASSSGAVSVLHHTAP